MGVRSLGTCTLGCLSPCSIFSARFDIRKLIYLGGHAAGAALESGEFEIDRNKLERNDADPTDIQGARFSDGVWQDLPTEVTEMTEETVTVEVQTPGFSVFTVYIDDETATPTPTPETTPTPIPPEQPTPTETDTPEDSDELGAFGMVGGIALLVVLVLVVVAGAALYRTRQDPTSDLLESLRSSDGSWLDRRR